MSDGRQESQWNQTAEVVAAIYNSNPYRTKDYVPAEFNPYARRRQLEPAKLPRLTDEQALQIFEKCWGLKREPEERKPKPDA